MITTKQQEREALAKIKKIIEGLGENSYIGTALAGCIEIADQNIEYDFGDSLQERLKIAEEKLRDEIGEKQAVKHDLEKATADIEALKKRRDELLADSKCGADKITELYNELGNAQRRAGEAENEVTRLKAKLYDYMTAEA